MFFTILIVISFVLYIFFKFKYFRTELPIEKRWNNTKANMAIGVFLLSFGLNQIIITTTTVSIIVGLIFSILGGANVIYGYKAYKHYLPLAIEEAENN